MYSGVLGRIGFIGMIGLVCTGVWIGCKGKSKEEPAQVVAKAEPTVDSRYATWKTFEFQNIKIMYPPGHPQESTLTNMGEAYVYLIRKVNEILGMQPITDTLTVYYYTGFGQGRELTGQQYPYADSQAIHFWLPSFYGPVIMQYLLPRWAPDPPRHKFLKHGLISMFDLSGQNYHVSTIGYKNSGEFIPLEKLAIDTATNSNEERLQSAEAASLCAYIISDFGAHALRELYLSPVSFDSSVSQTCFVPVDTLQNRWLAFVKLNVPKDSIRD
ncbi:MAG: hypothetical protein HY851_03705 [candidate division Zixibacteria bacterium]|nr:hypothetical protein [candidate division Zixibacteria bacterium]